MAAELSVTEIDGEDSEGRVLQAIAGTHNLYVMIVFDFDEDDGFSIRLPSNAPSVEIMKSMLERVLRELP